MWEFMTKYAESFWDAGEYAGEIFRVLMAWGITLASIITIITIIIAIGQVLKYKLIESAKEEE